MPKTVSIEVSRYRLFSITSAFSPRRSSMTRRMPSLSDSSRSAEIPSIRFSLTSSAIFSISRALLTWYGSSLTTMRSWAPPSAVSNAARART